MKHCMLCHWLLQRNRWLPFLLLLPVILALPLFAPVWLYLLLLSLHMLMDAMLLIYLRDLPQVYTPDHLHMPCARDGQAEIVMVDASLVDNGPMLVCAAQPITPVMELTPQMGQGAQLLGTAMLLLADQLSRTDRTVLATAAESQLGLRKADVLRRCTNLRRGREDGLQCVTVQEDGAERTYFTGDINAVLSACSSIWDGEERLLAADEGSRIRQSARDMSATGERLHAFAFAQGDDELTFLGMAAIGDSVDPVAAAQLRQLRSMGVTIELRDDGTQQMDVPVLRRNLDVPDLHARPDIHLCIANPYPDRHTLPIIRHQERSLVEPVKALREHFSSMAFMLGRLSGLLTLCLLCCVLAGGYYSVPAVVAVLTAGYLSFGSLVSARPIRLWETLLAGAGCLVIRLLLNAAAPAAQDMAGTLLCLTIAALMTLTLAVPGRKLTPGRLAPVLIATAVALALQLLRSLPVLGAALLPSAFCIICGLLISLAILFTRR